VLDPELDRDVEGRAVDAGLAAGDDTTRNLRSSRHDDLRSNRLRRSRAEIHAHTRSEIGEMMRAALPHVLGIDDGPFEKRSGAEVPLVGVVTAGPSLVESIAMTRFPVDGDAAAERLGAWISGLRVAPALHAIVLGGITIAGLGIIDVRQLAEITGVAVISVTRRAPSRDRLAGALRAAALEDRIELLDRAPAAVAVDAGLWVACAGVSADAAAAIVRATRNKAAVPEALRLAHLIARAVVLGESRGRV
jgi:endonuclease V-like protein UPF0215 family